MSAHAGLNVVVLVSVGRHPASGQPRRATLDAKALEMALRLPGAAVTVLHAGNPDEPALRDYLGMGMRSIEVIPLPPGADAVAALAARVEALNPALVLTGLHAEGGEDSGLLPYLLAERLGFPVLANVVALEQQSGGHMRGLLAEPRGQRRAVEAPLPLVAAIDPAAPVARQVALAVAQRGAIKTVAASVATPVVEGFTYSPARKRAKRMKIAKGSSLDRFKAATGVQGGGGKTLRNLSPEDAARRVLDFLLEEKVVGKHLDS